MIQKFIAPDSAVDPCQFPFTAEFHDIPAARIIFQPAQRRTVDTQSRQEDENEDADGGKQYFLLFQSCHELHEKNLYLRLDNSAPLILFEAGG